LFDVFSNEIRQLDRQKLIGITRDDDAAEGKFLTGAFPPHVFASSFDATEETCPKNLKTIMELTGACF
jgi:hypothetical protein